MSAVAIACLIAWELTDEHPVIDLRLFARRNFLVGVTCLFFGMMAFFGTVVILPLWLQQYQGYTALAAGQAIALGGVFAVVLGPIVGANIGRVDARAVATLGFLVFAVVALWSAHFTPDVDFWTVAQTRLYMGIGISFFFLPIVTINLSGLEAERIAAASGIVQLRAQPGLQLRHRHRDLDVGASRQLPSRGAGRAHQRLLEHGLRLRAAIGSLRPAA